MSATAIAGALDAAEVLPPAAVAWFSVRREVLPPGARATGAEARDAMREALAAILYRDFYCRGTARPSDPGGPRTGTAAERASLIAGVAAANTSRGTTSPGWRVDSVDPDGGLHARRGGLALVARPEQVASGEAIPGSLVTLRLPSTRRRWSPGFVTCVGERDIEPGEGLVRHYWNVRREGVPGLVTAVTRTLDAADVAFRLKVLADTADAARCDRAVVYVQAAEAARAAELLTGPVYHAVAADLAPRSPAMTLVLARGLSIAEDPGGGASFGAHRCSLLADAVLLAYRRRVSAIQAADEVFRAAGLRLETPHLGPRRVGAAA